MEEKTKFFTLIDNTGVVRAKAPLYKAIDFQEQFGWKLSTPENLTEEEKQYMVLRECMKLMLQPHGVRFEQVMPGGDKEYTNIYEKKKYLWGLINVQVLKNQIVWHEYYKWESQQQYDEWKKKCVKLIQDKLSLSRYLANKWFLELDKDFGLKIKQ